MLDFTSALYLGFWHASRSLRPWTQLTTGVPAALAEPRGAKAVAKRLASLQGCQNGTLGASTLHLFWDLFGMLADEQIAVYLDAGAYPIARWGVERAAARRVPVHTFRHQDAETLDRLLRRHPGRRRPVVVTDGLCAGCGIALPLAAYLDSVRHVGGLLVIDDTQAMGILGGRPERPTTPYGQGGGGSLRYHNIGGPDLLVVSSLAKGFGAPLAVLSGGDDTIRNFQARSETRVHCSPPSAAAIHAAGRALKLNAERGDAQRLILARRVQQFRRGLSQMGLSADGGLFPVQTLNSAPDLDARQLYQRLLKLGVRGVLRRHQGARRISFVITAKHGPDEIERAVNALGQAMRTMPQPLPEHG